MRTQTRNQALLLAFKIDDRRGWLEHRRRLHASRALPAALIDTDALRANPDVMPAGCLRSRIAVTSNEVHARSECRLWIFAAMGSVYTVIRDGSFLQAQLYGALGITTRAQRRGSAKLLQGISMRNSKKWTTGRIPLCLGLSLSGATTMSIPGLALGASAVNQQGFDELQEIVVTAERRESTVLKTPISMTAISGEDLQAQGLTRLEDVAAEVPGISMKQFAPGQTEYEMRGLPSSGGSSATVGMYVNDVPFASSANSLVGKEAIDPDLFDLKRIEILRGPQGTLYGAGSMGGTIRLITAPADAKKFDAAAQLGISQTEHGGTNWGVSAMVNLPVVHDVLAVRLVATDKYSPGFIDRIVVSPFPIGPTGACGWPTCTRGNVEAAPVVARSDNYNWDRLLNGRISARFTPTDDLTADLLAMSQRISLGGFPQADVTSVGVNQLAYYQPQNTSDDIRDYVDLYSLNVNYDLSFATLTSTTAKWEHHSAIAGDDSEVGEYLINYFYGDPRFWPSVYHNSDYVEQFSEEVRLTSRGESPLQWVTGLFYSNFESIQHQYVNTPGLAYLTVGGAAANPNGVMYASYLPYIQKQYALFAEGSYKFANALKLTVGVRGFKYSANQHVETFGVFTQTGNLTPTVAASSASATGASPKVNLSYQPSENLNWYAQIAKGFRPGGANQPAPVSLCGTTGPLSYAPDSIWDYEVGEKAKLLGGALQINADVYYIRWNHVQQQLTLSCSYPFQDNIGTAESFGPELEVNAKLNRYLDLSVAGTTTTSRITSVEPNLAGNTIGATERLAPGVPVLNIPKYTLSTALNVTYPVTDRYKLTGRLSETTTGKFYDIDYNVQQLPGYTFVDLRLGLAAGAWSTYLYVNNMANKIAKLSVDTHSWTSPVPGYQRAVVNQPRTVGIDFDYKL